jgi:zinc protease
VTFSAHAALNLADPVPVGPQVVVGKLPNGLTYYIQKNSRPEKRLELRLVVKAGSALEDEDQRGLAHFAEHMAFNGSTHFQKSELISYLQSIGLKFGADLNAYTSFNETVYILPMPTDKKENIEKGFLVLEDWAQGIAFDKTDVDMERNIILEEARLRKGAQDRLIKALYPKLFADSRYANRLPIGDENLIKAFEVDTLKRFYKDWYRPDLMAVVVVGDIDPAQALALVESHFGKLKNPTKERPRDYATIPARDRSETLVFLDQELPNNSLQIHYPQVTDPQVVTYGDYRTHLMDDLFGTMMSLRLQELTQQASPPFGFGGSVYRASMPGYRSFSSYAVLGRQGVGPAMDALIKENERARQFGFSAAELERAKLTLMRQIEQAKAERDKTDSAQYAAEYIRAFVVHETIPGIDNELAYYKELFPTITPDDVNRFAKTAIPDSKASKLVVYSGSGSSGSEVPTEVQLLTRAKEAEKILVSARQENALATSLMAKLPKPGRIAAERKNEAFGLTELELSNGVKVVLKPTDFKDDQILMSAVRRGGQSLYGQKDMYNALYAGDAVASMGLGDFTPTDLQKILSGKAVSISTKLDTYSDSVGGAAGKADLETLFQLIHLKLGAARTDNALYQSFVTRNQDIFKNALEQPDAQLLNAVRNTSFNAHPRLLLTPRPENFDQLQQSRQREIYQDRFGSAKGMTFFFVGSFSVETMKPLIATYLASLPTTETPTHYVDLGIRPVTGVVKKEVLAGKEQKAQVIINFMGSAAYSEQEQLRLNALKEVLNIKIIEVLREKRSLIYTAGVYSDLSLIPYENYQVQLALPCAPENVDKVVAGALEEIQKIQEHGPEAADLAKFKTNWNTERRNALRENGYWLGRLRMATYLERELVPVPTVDKWVNDITVDDLKDAARIYLNAKNYVQVVLKPK